MRRAMTYSALVFASVLMIVALAGCGGGSGKTAATPPSTPVMPPGDSPQEPDAATPIEGLPEGLALEPGTLSPGESRVLQETDGMRTLLTCPAGGDPCVISVGPDGPESTGGAPTVATYTPVALPSGHSLEPGARTVPAGGSLTVWAEGAAETVVTCPDDGPACEVTFRSDGSAEYTGGTPAVVTSITGLPEGHGLTAGTTIPAGATTAAGEEGRIWGYSRGRGSGLACPAGGEDCFVAWVSGSTAEFEGGAPTLTTLTNEMVWQANNGPDGTSAGAHATGFEGRLLSGSTLHGMFTNSALGNVERAGAIVHSSLHPEPTVTETASWDSGTAPTLGLSVNVASLRGPPPVDRDSSIPSLGEGWNGVALSDTFGTLNFNGHAVIYSNIEKAVGGTQDEYYLTLGAWLVTPTDPASASTIYNWGAFANGHAATALSRAQIIALTGTATYQGPATGLYSKATFTGSGGTRALQSSHVGSFTATATINADFDMNGTVAGSITDFEENGQSLGEWTVNFPATQTIVTGSSETFFGRSGGSADGQALTGEWGVQPYRNSATSGAEMVAGTFTSSTAAANNDALHMVGAFGAERQ